MTLTSFFRLFTAAMVTKGQLLTCFLTVVGVALVAAKGKECGDNPMKQVLLVAKRTGKRTLYGYRVNDGDRPCL